MMISVMIMNDNDILRVGNTWMLFINLLQEEKEHSNTHMASNGNQIKLLYDKLIYLTLQLYRLSVKVR